MSSFESPKVLQIGEVLEFRGNATTIENGLHQIARHFNIGTPHADSKNVFYLPGLSQSFKIKWETPYEEVGGEGSGSAPTALPMEFSIELVEAFDGN